MADVNISLKIPDVHVTIGFTAISAMVNVPINIACSGLFAGGNGHVYVNIAPKTGGETNKQFAERWICEFVRAAIEMYKLAEDTARRNGEISALDPVTEDVDENVIIPA